MEVARFEDIQAEFMRRAQQAVYCSVATIDLHNRPRSRIMHVIWDGPTGWVITRPGSPKTRHLAQNPHASLAYIGDPQRPMYIESVATWEDEAAEQQRIWDLHRATPPPLGFDPAPHYGTTRHPLFGLLRFRPWRIELAELGQPSQTWRPGSAA